MVRRPPPPELSPSDDRVVAVARALHDTIHQDTGAAIRFTSRPWDALGPEEQALKARVAAAFLQKMKAP